MLAKLEFEPAARVSENLLGERLPVPALLAYLATVQVSDKGWFFRTFLILAFKFHILGNPSIPGKPGCTMA